MTIVFYVNIDKILKNRGLTLTQLAYLTGLSQGHLSNIKKTKAISMNSLSKIATGLSEENILNLIDIQVKKTNS